MNETEYHLLCDQWFERIENMLEEADLDFDSMGGVIEAELSSGAKMIINRQPATREVWVAEAQWRTSFCLARRRLAAYSR